MSYKRLADAGDRAGRAAEVLRRRGKPFTAGRLDNMAEVTWEAAHRADPAAWERDVEQARKGKKPKRS